jgi:drug/metabolite transporter (DMT)-like permease
MKKYFCVFSLVVFIFAVSGCNPYNNAGEGAGVGGVLGAVAGGVIGHQSHDTGAGMLIGGVVGAAAGAAVGSQIQKPEPPPTVVMAQPAPVVMAQPPATVETQDSVTVNVPNSDGTYAAVVLKKSGNGFMGPQGEYYAQLPTTDQLRVMYGK